MKVISLSVDDGLLERIDALCAIAGVSRSAFCSSILDDTTEPLISLISTLRASDGAAMRNRGKSAIAVDKVLTELLAKAQGAEKDIFAILEERKK